MRCGWRFCVVDWGDPPAPARRGKTCLQAERGAEAPHPVTFLCRRNAQSGGSVNNSGFASSESPASPEAPPSPHPIDGGDLLVVFTASASWRVSPALLALGVESDTEQTTLPQICCVVQGEVQWG